MNVPFQDFIEKIKGAALGLFSGANQPVSRERSRARAAFDASDDSTLQRFQEAFRRGYAKFRFNALQRAQMYEDLAAFQEAGIPPYEAIVAINEVHRRRGNPLEYMTGDWIEALESGSSIGNAMAPWVDPGEVTMIASGEKAGTFEESLREAAKLTRQRKEMISLAASQLFMPVLLITALFGFVYYIAATIVPTARELLPDEFMPGFAKSYFGFGEFTLTWGPWLTLLLVVLAGLIVVTLPIWTGKWRDRADRLFPWTIFRSMQSAFFLLTLSAMLRSGMAPMTSLVELKRYSRPWVQMHLDRMIGGLTQGKRETESLDTGMLMRSMSDRLFVYSQLPDFSVVMKSLGEDAVINLKATINAITQTTAMVVMVLLALFVMATVFALGETSFAISDMVERQSTGI